VVFGILEERFDNIKLVNYVESFCSKLKDLSDYCLHLKCCGKFAVQVWKVNTHLSPSCSNYERIDANNQTHTEDKESLLLLTMLPESCSISYYVNWASIY
jgi:hypothetical protein